MHSIPTLIIGGGIAGASLASALAERESGGAVTLVDIDLFGRSSASATSGGGVHTFSPYPLDVRLSIASVQFFRQLATKIDFRQVGSLRLCDQASWEQVRASLPDARTRGVAADELTPSQAKARFPLLGDVQDLGGALVLALDGYLSLHKLRMQYLNFAEAGGVTFMDGWQVAAIEGTGPPFRVTLRRIGLRSVRKALTAGIGKGDDLVVEAGRMVNAAGSWASRVAALCGRALPVLPVPRQLVLLRQAGVHLMGHPFIVDNVSHINFRQSEFDRKPCVLVDAPNPLAANQIEFAAGDYTKDTAPRVVSRLPALTEAEVLSIWAAHNESTPDGRAIVGAAPGLPGLFNFSGISARTMSQCHMLAEGMAEFLVNGQWPDDLNLEELNESRFAPTIPPAVRS